MLYMVIFLAFFVMMLLISMTNWVGKISSLEEENYLLRAENYEAKKRNEKLREQMILITRQVMKTKQQSN